MLENSFPLVEILTIYLEKVKPERFYEDVENPAELTVDFD